MRFLIFWSSIESSISKKIDLCDFQTLEFYYADSNYSKGKCWIYTSFFLIFKPILVIKKYHRRIVSFPLLKDITFAYWYLEENRKCNSYFPTENATILSFWNSKNTHWSIDKYWHKNVIFLFLINNLWHNSFFFSLIRVSPSKEQLMQVWVLAYSKL